MMTFKLEEKIAHYLATLAVWDAAEDETECLPLNGPEYDAHVMAEQAFVYHSCRSNDDVRRKVEFVIAHGYMFETIQGNGKLLSAFMRSLIIGHDRAVQHMTGTPSNGHTLPQEAAAMGETFQPHQNGEDG
ncbi:hypothetical protein [Rhizobium sp. Leaf383]|uniref:hypothetical protein n=1 Tax=Rhizobium sp. Leaf383 TaxID=1736357 RepID=UPI0007126B94|nr:hypothetical protein [Rhizobium sp. Leaf383]KQS83447.1 hypothetical protein ASG58_22195 [Rhizobium sp. Leaf383]